MTTLSDLNEERDRLSFGRDLQHGNAAFIDGFDAAIRLMEERRVKVLREMVEESKITFKMLEDEGRFYTSLLTDIERALRQVPELKDGDGKEEFGKALAAKFFEEKGVEL